MQKNLGNITHDISEIGAEIGLELGNYMISSFRTRNPNSSAAYEVGRNILENILAQPGCAGIRFYDALNEDGQKTLVYVGIDKSGKTIVEQILVNNSGEICTTAGIVADRIRLPGTKPWGGIADDDGGWSWSID